MKRIDQADKASGGMRSIIGLAGIALLLGACSAGSGSTSATASASASSAAASASASASESTAASGGATIKVSESSLGKILTDAAGRTVYRFTPDSKDTSTCSGGCAANWPAVTVTGSATAGDGVTGQVATMTRDDGSTQVTVNGFPVYYFAGDAAAGDVNGQGVGGKWFVITADGEMKQQ